MKLLNFRDSLLGLGRAYKPTTLVSHHEDYTVGETTGGLSVFFTTLCIVDLFGVFPVIALPKSIISCGIYGVPMVLAVFALQIYTALLLGKSWLVAQEISPQIGNKNRFPYAAVAELAFGRRARRLVTCLIDATVFGAGVPNLIVASQSLQLFWWKITGGEVGVSYCLWMLLLGLLLCPVMWLGSPKDMKPLALASVFIVGTVAAATWSCILTDDVSPRPRVDWLAYRPRLHDFLAAYGIIAFQFDIHPMLLTIQVDMRSPRRVRTAVLAGFAVTAAAAAVTALLAARRYGLDVDANILQGIPPSVPLYVVALLVTLQLCLSSAVGNSALFQNLEDLLRVPRDFSLKRCVLRSSVVAAAVLLGETVPRFDLVMGLVGSTLTGPLMFVFPPLFFLKLCHMRRYLEASDPDFPFNKDCRLALNSRSGGHFGYSTFERGERAAAAAAAPVQVRRADVAAAGAVVALGAVATVAATAASWAEAVAAARFTPPCLYNVTAAARDLIESTRRL